MPRPLQRGRRSGPFLMSWTNSYTGESTANEMPCGLTQNIGPAARHRRAHQSNHRVA
jgi:hypothetical protein